MFLLSKIYPFPATANFGEQTILFHNSQQSFGFFWYFCLVAISRPICNRKFCPSYSDIPPSFLLAPHLSPAYPSALRNRNIRSEILQKPAHNRYQILVAVAIDNCILDLWPHILPVNCGKSRRSMFSILNRSISFFSFWCGGSSSFHGLLLYFGIALAFIDFLAASAPTLDGTSADSKLPTYLPLTCSYSMIALYRRSWLFSSEMLSIAK